MFLITFSCRPGTTSVQWCKTQVEVLDFLSLLTYAFPDARAITTFVEIA